MTPEFLGRNHPNKTMELFQLLQNRLFDEVDSNAKWTRPFWGESTKQKKQRRQRKKSSPGDSIRALFIPDRWRSPKTPWKGDLTIPKRSLWWLITTWSIFIHPRTFNSQKKTPGKPWMIPGSWFIAFPCLFAWGFFSVKLWVGSSGTFRTLPEKILTPQWLTSPSSSLPLYLEPKVEFVIWYIGDWEPKGSKYIAWKGYKPTNRNPNFGW